jgi:hypothetical protein
LHEKGMDLFRSMRIFANTCMLYKRDLETPDPVTKHYPFGLLAAYVQIQIDGIEEHRSKATQIVDLIGEITDAQMFRGMTPSDLDLPTGGYL